MRREVLEPSHNAAVTSRSALVHCGGQLTVRVMVATAEVSCESLAVKLKASVPQALLLTCSVAEGSAPMAVTRCELESRIVAEEGREVSVKSRPAAAVAGGLSASEACSVSVAFSSTVRVKVTEVATGRSFTAEMVNAIVAAADERKSSPGQSVALYVNESAPLALASGT